MQKSIDMHLINNEIKLYFYNVKHFRKENNKNNNNTVSIYIYFFYFWRQMFNLKYATVFLVS